MVKIKPTTTIQPYRDEQTIKNIILDIAQKRKQVVYGQQAINAQLPKHLKRKTKDYDIYTSKPKESADELVNRLNKEYKRKRFKVTPAVHKGTYKVKSGRKTVADYTLARKKPMSKKVLGIAYAKLKYQKVKLKKILKDKASEFRHKKDMKTLSKIKEYEMGEFLYS